MSLISILLVAVAVLTLSLGLLSFLGAQKNDRKRTVWVFVSDIGAAIWIVSMAVFLALEPASSNIDMVALVSINGIYIGTLLMVTAILGYACWQYVFGKIATILSAIVSCVFAFLIIADHTILYTGYEITNQNNTVHLVNGWFYWLYVLALVVMIMMFTGATYYRSKHNTNKKVRTGDLVLTYGFMVVGVVAAIFDMILPILGRYDLIWLGPIALSVTMLSYFYAILKYRIISISATGLKALAYVSILSTGAAVYMVIFYIIFTVLFKVANPAPSVLVLNFLMIVIVLLLMPVIREISAAVNALITMGQVDLAYVVKKLNKIAAKNVDLRDLAAFLADHLHFSYVGFIINGRVYGSKALAISSEELSSISHLRQTANGVWQEPNKTVQKIFNELDLKAVAELRNAKGKTFGQLIVGKPMGKSSFERRDLIQLEMIINLVATVIDSEKHIRA